MRRLLIFSTAVCLAITLGLAQELFASEPQTLAVYGPRRVFVGSKFLVYVKLPNGAQTGGKFSFYAKSRAA